MNRLRQFGLILMSLLYLTACSTGPVPLDSPCDDYGQHCEPKIPINQWDRNAIKNEG